MSIKCKECWSYPVCHSGQRYGVSGPCWEPCENDDSAEARIHRYPLLLGELEKLREFIRDFSTAGYQEVEELQCVASRMTEEWDK